MLHPTGKFRLLEISWGGRGDCWHMSKLSHAGKSGLESGVGYGTQQHSRSQPLPWLIHPPPPLLPPCFIPSLLPILPHPCTGLTWSGRHQCSQCGASRKALIFPPALLVFMSPQSAFWSLCKQCVLPAQLLYKVRLQVILINHFVPAVAM